MTDYLDEIQARADAATDGPWEHVGSYGRIVSGPVQVCRAYGDDGKATPDAPFIAHARTDVPRLVAALRAVEALHTRVGSDDQNGFCVACCDMEPLWPCPTVTAIRDALGGQP